jgi:hypothetical protein
MGQILHGIAGVTCYLDVVLVAGKTLEQAERRLIRVFTRLEKFTIRVNKKKCIFLQEEVEYVVHLVNSKGIHPLPSKISALREAPIPKTAEELATFLGVINYYHDHLLMLSAVAKPLYEAANSSNFTWNSVLDHSYSTVKKLLTSSLVLVPYKSTKPLIVTADASPTGIGGVISLLIDGVERPVAFTSRTLTKV